MALSLARLRSSFRHQFAVRLPSINFAGMSSSDLSMSAAVVDNNIADSVNRLKFAYADMIVPLLIEEFNYKNVYQVPKVEKIVVNCLVGDAARVEVARNDLALVTGQRPTKPKIEKAFANFKSKETQPLGIAVTLRGNVMYSFLDRLINLGLPRMNDFQGVRPNSFDGNGNYRLCFREPTVFPEITFDVLGKPGGMDISIKTTATTDAEAYKLLAHMGMPFKDGGPTTIVRKKKLKSKGKTKQKTRKR